MEDLFRALPALLDNFDNDENLRESVVFAAWRKIAGDALRDHAVPVKLIQKHLVVAVESERWQKYLKDLGGQMIFKLNSALGKALVTFIEFRIDSSVVLEERAKHRKRTFDEDKERELALDQITPQMRRAADAIKDDDLRYQFLLAAGSCLVRKKNLKNQS